MAYYDTCTIITGILFFFMTMPCYYSKHNSYLSINCSKKLFMTYRPHTSSKCHWIWHATGEVWCAKGETVISDISSAVSSQRTVACVSIIGSRQPTQAEYELIVTFTRTKAKGSIAASSIAFLTVRVLVSVCSHLENVASSTKLHMQGIECQALTINFSNNALASINTV